MDGEAEKPANGYSFVPSFDEVYLLVYKNPKEIEATARAPLQETLPESSVFLMMPLRSTWS